MWRSVSHSLTWAAELKPKIHNHADLQAVGFELHRGEGGWGGLRGAMWQLWLYFNLDGQWRSWRGRCRGDVGFLWERLRFMSPVLAAGPTSSLICFYSDDPLTSGGSLESPWMVQLAAGPSWMACFFNQITIFNKGHKPRAKSKQTSVW